MLPNRFCVQDFPCLSMLVAGFLNLFAGQLENTNNTRSFKVKKYFIANLSTDHQHGNLYFNRLWKDLLLARLAVSSFAGKQPGTLISWNKQRVPKQKCLFFLYSLNKIALPLLLVWRDLLCQRVAATFYNSKIIFVCSRNRLRNPEVLNHFEIGCKVTWISQL